MPRRGRKPPASQAEVQSSSRPLDTVSREEIAYVLLLQVFDKIAPLLGEHVKRSLQRAYGEQTWLGVAASCLSRRMWFIVTGNPRVLTEDIYVITEVIMSKLDQVFVEQGTLDVLGLIDRSDLLLSVAADADCVGQTRTCLFHSVQISVQEVYRCVLAAERLCRRLVYFELAEKEEEDVSTFFEDVRKKLKVRCWQWAPASRICIAQHVL